MRVFSTCQDFFNQTWTNGKPSGLGLGEMAQKAPKVPAFGAYLQQQRGDRSRESIVRQMTHANVQRDQSALAKAETEGRLPAVDLLRGVNLVYKVPFEELVDQVLAELRVTPVRWRIAQSDAAEVVRDDEEAELLRLFRLISESRQRLFVRDMVVRLVEDWSDGVPQKRKRRRGQFIEESSEQPTVPTAERRVQPRELARVTRQSASSRRRRGHASHK